MDTITLSETDYVTLRYDAERNMIHHQFHQPLGGEQFREVLNMGVDAMKEYNADKWLSDDRKNAIISEEDTEWAIHTWSENSIAQGWKYWALVVPEDMSARMNLTEHIQAYAEKGIMVRVFTQPDEALNWIDSL